MSSPHDTTIDATYASADRANTVESSLRQEIGEIDDGRSRTTIERTGSTLSIRILAADLVALRAASNTWLSLLSVAEETAAIGRNQT